ncbi:MAG: OsmC family protein [Syntrophomonadaceae bacterium]|jgi:uncharacterized OsmC-like protein
MEDKIKTIQLTVDWAHIGVKSIARVGEHTVVEMGKGSQSQSEDRGASPLETFLSSLGGCIMVFLAQLAQKRRMQIDDIRIYIEGDFDPRGMSSSSTGIRSGFQEIRYQVVVDSPDNPDMVRKLVEQAVKICPVKDTIMNGTTVIESQLSKHSQ